MKKILSLIIFSVVFTLFAFYTNSVQAANSLQPNQLCTTHAECKEGLPAGENFFFCNSNNMCEAQKLYKTVVSSRHACRSNAVKVNNNGVKKCAVIETCVVGSPLWWDEYFPWADPDGDGVINMWDTLNCNPRIW